MASIDPPGKAGTTHLASGFQEELKHIVVKNIFVLGLDEHNRRLLESLPNADGYRFHRLLSDDDLTTGDIEFDESLAKAEAELHAFEGTVHAIVGYWDFPVSSMVPILCHRRGLASADLESVLKCEHKYWSRVQQQDSIPEYPRFGLAYFDDEAPPDGLRYPMWLKPVKSFSSDLAFRVHDEEEFRSALAEVRRGIGRVGRAFDAALTHIDLPPDIERIGGQACLVEEAVSGFQVTVEGFHDGHEVQLYGVIDSHNYEGTSSFLRYEYPSQLPQDVVDRLETSAQRVVEHIGLRSVFNIEYFWNPEDGSIRLLEINPRQSQSHAEMFEYVDGVAHHEYMLRLALGETPQLRRRHGPYAVAAKWFYRRFGDGIVRRAPTASDVAKVTHDVPGTSIEIEASDGVRLSDLPGQDSYSYNLAVVHTAGQTADELQEKYDQCVSALQFEIDDITT